MIRCLIIDDEELARTLLSNYISRLPHVELAGTCKNPPEAMAHLLLDQVDLLLLDIQMPELSGTEFLRSLPKRPLVIFTTAYPDYALEGYELDVVDYLLKPFSFERFVQAIQKATERLKLKNNPVTDHDFLLVKSEHRLHRLKLDDILFIEGMREYVAFHTRSGGKILSLLSLKQLEEELPAHAFIRIHKSYIVSIQGIKTLEGNQLMVDGGKLPIGASFREEVLKRCFG
ncbi:MAG TPA: LytTR family DNA-binding domain-containing protein [Saprospiraceae bacterium]|nr:LytTR family DNA-binding domain-containing protein [Saprospiraceae bacterium]